MAMSAEEPPVSLAAVWPKVTRFPLLGQHVLPPDHLWRRPPTHGRVGAEIQAASGQALGWLSLVAPRGSTGREAGLQQLPRAMELSVAEKSES